jgi:hypothetical protein
VVSEAGSRGPCPLISGSRKETPDVLMLRSCAPTHKYLRRQTVGGRACYFGSKSAKTNTATTKAIAFNTPSINSTFIEPPIFLWPGVYYFAQATSVRSVFGSAGLVR